MKKKLVQIKQKDLKDFRHRQWLKQDKRCAVCQKKILFNESVVDHKHKRKKDPAGVDGMGMIRGVIHRNINQLEGKISKTYVRYGLSKLAPLPDILRGLAEYIEHPPVDGFLHPSCIPKVKKKKLNKTDIKRVLKYWDQMYPNRKKPKITKTVTKQWAAFIEESRKLAGLGKKEKDNGIRCITNQKKKTDSKRTLKKKKRCQRKEKRIRPS